MLLFIGAALGLLMALLLGVVSVLPGVTQGFGQDATVNGFAVRELTMVLGAAAFVVGVYGLVSLVLASLMGKRSPALFWTVLVFQVLMLFLALASLTYGALQAVVPLLFTIAIIVLLLLPGSRAFYLRP